MNRCRNRSERLRSAARTLFGGLLLFVLGQVKAQNIYLLGEIHDNPQGHAQRLVFIESLVAKDPNTIIAMEQFDRDRQSALDQAMRTCAEADCVIREAAGPGWQWNFYKPVIEIAMRHQIRIVAANVSGKDTFKIARNGLRSSLDAQTMDQFDLERPLESAFSEKQRDAIDAGHCRMLPKQVLPGMVNAQVARDVWMARVIREHSSQPMVPRE